MATVSELTAKLGIELDQASVKQATQSLSNFGKTISAVLAGVAAGFAATGLTNFIRQTAESASLLSVYNRRLGLSTQFLQEFAGASRQAGIGTEEAFNAIQKLQDVIATASTTGSGSDLFARLGINLFDQTTKDAKTLQQIVSEIPAGFQRLPRDVNRAQTAIELFGSIRFADVVADGPERFQELIEQARRSETILSDGFFKAAERTNRQAVALGEQIRLLGIQLSDVFVPPLIDAARFLVRLTRKVRPFLKSGLEKFIFSLTRIFGAFTDVVGRVLDKFDSLKADLRGLSKEFDVFKTTVVAIGLTLGLAFAPLTTTIALLFLLIDDLVAYYDGRGSVIGLIADKLQKNFNGVYEAIKIAVDFFSEWEIILLAVGAALGPIFGPIIAIGVAVKSIIDNLNGKESAFSKFLTLPDSVIDPIVEFFLYLEDQLENLSKFLSISKLFDSISNLFSKDEEKEITVTENRKVKIPDMKKVEMGFVAANRQAQNAMVTNNTRNENQNKQVNNNTTNVENKNTFNVNVQTKTNANPDEIAQSVRSQIDEYMDQQGRELLPDALLAPEQQ